MKKLTPIRAIRAKCLDCCLDQPREVNLCGAKTCPVWPYRLGRRPDRQLDGRTDGARAALTPVRAVRARCLDCSEGQKEVRDCRIADCAIWPYRMGRRPSTGECGTGKV